MLKELPQEEPELDLRVQPDVLNQGKEERKLPVGGAATGSQRYTVFWGHRNLQDDGEGKEARKLLTLTPSNAFFVPAYGHHRNLRGQPKNANGERNLTPQLFRPDFHRNLQDDGEGEEDRKLFAFKVDDLPQ